MCIVPPDILHKLQINLGRTICTISVIPFAIFVSNSGYIFCALSTVFLIPHKDAAHFALQKRNLGVEEQV
jgi:hypothetical protein